MLSVFTEGVSYDNIGAHGRGVPFPLKFAKKVRRHTAKQKAAEVMNSSGCPRRVRGYEGEADGQDIKRDTNMTFEWCAIRTVAQIRYNNLVSLGRLIPNCKIRLAGRPWHDYSVDFF